jgi:hypothetical protein
MEKTIRFIDVFHHFVDSGWGQRVYSLEQAYHIGYETNFKYNILVQTPHWPELHFLNIPNVTGIDCQDPDEFIKLENGETASYLGPELLNEILMNKQYHLLDQSDHWYFHEWIEETKDLVRQTYFIKEIKFKDNKIEEYLKDKFKDFVGLHLRRRYWVKVEREDLKTLPDHLADRYWNEIALDKDTPIDHYVFIPDEEYYNVLDKIVEENENQKIFISSDLPYEFYEYYYDRYKNMYSFKDFEDEFKAILKETIDDSIVEKYPDTVNSLFDSFALSYCKLIVNTPSCFSMFSSDRNEVPTITIKKSNQKFIVFNYPHHKGFLHNN